MIDEPKTDPDPFATAALHHVFAAATYGPDMRLRSANLKFLRLFDGEPAALEGRPERWFLADDDGAMQLATTWQALREGKTISALVRRHPRFGVDLWLHATYLPTMTGGSLRDVVAILVEMSAEALGPACDRGQIEAILASQAVVHFDPQGIILEANESFLETMGFEADDILGSHHRIFMNAEEAAGEAYALFWRDLAEGRHKVDDFRRIAKDGREVWLRATYGPIRDPAGRVVRIIAYGIDVTDEKLRQADYEWQIDAIRKSHATITFDLHGIIIEANDVFLEATGYTREEILGRHHRMFMEPAESHGLEYAAFWRDLKRGRHRVGQYRRFGKGGREMWLQATYNPIFDMAGRPIKIVKYAHVITEDKRQEAEHRGQIAAIHKSQCVISFALDGTILDANDNFLDAMGYRLVEVRGRHHRMFVDPVEAAGEAYGAFWDKLACGEPQAGEFRRVSRDGRRRWLQATYNPVLDLNGRPFRIVKYAVDVTEEKERRADFECQMAAISKSQGVVSLDLDGTILAANEQFLASVGYALNEVAGRHHSMLVPSDERDSQDYVDFWRKLRSGQFHTGMYKRVGKGGRDVWLQATYNPILDLDGQPIKVVKFATDVTSNVSLAAAFADASRQAQHDPTTALPNRLRLSRFLAEALEAPAAKLAVLYLDLDRFKPVNDTYGHAVGDHVLGEIADRLRHSLAEGQLVARVGGDEFVVVAPGLVAIADVDALGRRIIEAVGRPIRYREGEIVLSASVGIALAPTDGSSADELLNKADIALYNSKRHGRGSFSFYGSGTTERAVSDKDTLEAMRAGLARGEFVLEYQPRFGTRDRTVRCLEALVRWNHPERGRLEPEHFIALAERTSFLAPLGAWAMATACRTAAGLADLRISINVSSDQFRGAGFLETVAAALEQSGLVADRLELEIPERAVLDDPAKAEQLLSALKTIGVRLAFDGFGIGLSSIHHLHGLPFDAVKIDRTLVARIDGKADGGADLPSADSPSADSRATGAGARSAKALVAAIIACGRALGLAVTAVGVETFGQLALLTHEQCPEVQGDLMSRPLEARHLAEFIARAAGDRPARPARVKPIAQAG